MSEGIIRVVAQCGAKVDEGTCGEQLVAELYLLDVGEYDFDAPEGWHIQARREACDWYPGQPVMVRCPKHCQRVTSVKADAFGEIRSANWVDAP